MTATILKYTAVALLFAAWGAIVFTGKGSAPGADVFIAWIQIALTGLGVHAAVTTVPGFKSPDTAPPKSGESQPQQEPKQ